MVKTFGVQWHITDICNLYCKHCYREKEINDLTIAENINIFENFKRLPVRLGRKIDISLTGGEAILYPQFKELVSYLRADECVNKIHLMTNGISISNELIEFLLKNDMKAIQISLDGSQVNHDFIRGHGTYEKSLTNIMKLKAHGIEVQVHLVLNKSNINDVFALINELDKIGVTTFLATHLVPIGNGTDMKDVLINKEEWKRYQEGTFIYEDQESPSLRILKGRATWNLFGKQYGSSCPVGVNSLNILANGTVVLCRRAPVEIGNLLEDSIFKIWYDTDILWEMRDKDNLKGKCGRCPEKLNCGGCRALALAFNNDIMGEDPYCWRSDD